MMRRGGYFIDIENLSNNYPLYVIQDKSPTSSPKNKKTKASSVSWLCCCAPMDGSSSNMNFEVLRCVAPFTPCFADEIKLVVGDFLIRLPGTDSNRIRAYNLRSNCQGWFAQERVRAIEALDEYSGGSHLGKRSLKRLSGELRLDVNVKPPEPNEPNQPSISMHHVKAETDSGKQKRKVRLADNVSEISRDESVDSQLIQHSISGMSASNRSLDTISNLSDSTSNICSKHLCEQHQHQLAHHRHLQDLHQRQQKAAAEANVHHHHQHHKPHVESGKLVPRHKHGPSSVKSEPVKDHGTGQYIHPKHRKAHAAFLKHQEEVRLRMKHKHKHHQKATSIESLPSHHDQTEQLLPRDHHSSHSLDHHQQHAPCPRLRHHRQQDSKSNMTANHNLQGSVCTRQTMDSVAFDFDDDGTRRTCPRECDKLGTALSRLGVSLVLGMAVFVIFWLYYGAKFITSLTVCVAITGMTTALLIKSAQARCIGLMSLPTLFTRQGRSIVLASIISILFSSACMNIYYNLGTPLENLRCNFLQIVDTMNMMSEPYNEIVRKISGLFSKTLPNQGSAWHLPLEIAAHNFYHLTFDNSSLLDLRSKLREDYENIIIPMTRAAQWLSNFLTFCIIIVVCYRAYEYVTKFRVKDNFDNMFITPGLMKLDEIVSERTKKRRLMPLRLREKERYIEMNRCSLLPGERREFLFGFIYVVIHFLMSGFIIYTDYFIYKYLNLVHSNLDAALETTVGYNYNVTVPTKLNVVLDPKGTQMLWQNSTENSHNMWKIGYDAGKCRTRPRPPSERAIIAIFSLYVVAILTVLLQSYMLRLRPYIANQFYSERAQERTIYLYHRILQDRKEFRRKVRLELTSVRKENFRTFNARDSLLFSVARAINKPKRWWTEATGFMRKNECNGCGRKMEAKPIHCRTGTCLLRQFCQACEKELGKTTPLCVCPPQMTMAPGDDEFRL